MHEICSYVTNLKENIKSSENINKNVILLQSIQQNVVFVCLIWFLGCTIFGSFLIYAIILYKGFSLGYTVSAIIGSMGIKSRMYIFNLIFTITEYCFSSSDIYVIYKWDKTISQIKARQIYQYENRIY